MGLEIRNTELGVIIPVKVVPGGTRSRIAGLWDRALKINIAAQPEKGKANKHLVRFLAQLLDRPKNSITIVGGTHNTRKLIQIADMDCEKLIKLLQPYLPDKND